MFWLQTRKRSTRGNDSRIIKVDQYSHKKALFLRVKISFMVYDGNTEVEEYYSRCK